MILANRRGVLLGLLAAPAIPAACQPIPAPAAEAPKAAAAAAEQSARDRFGPNANGISFAAGPWISVVAPHGPGTLPLHVLAEGFEELAWTVVRPDFTPAFPARLFDPRGRTTVLRPALRPGEFVRVLSSDGATMVDSALFGWRLA